MGFLGILVILTIAYSLSDNRSKINWTTVATGIGLQLVFAFFMLMDIKLFGVGLKDAIELLSYLFVKLINYSSAGATFIFGVLADPMNLGNYLGAQNGFIFAFNALTVIIFFGSLMAVLYHYGVMQFVVRLMAKAMVKVLKISGAEAIAVSANVFVGQTEAPLVIKPYLEKMTRSEIMTIMVGGMATIAGGVMAAYVAMLGGPNEADQILVASRLLTASFMAAPATIVMAKLMIPETEHSVTYGKVEMEVEKTASNGIEAAANGASDGLHLALNVAAMLLAFIALIALLNGMTEFVLTDLLNLRIDGKAINLSVLIGYVFSIFGLLIGVPSQDMVAFGSMLGEKLIVNEFVAYSTLSQIQSTLDPKTVFLATFAFCGFANFSSIAIQIGGIGVLAPSKRSMIAKLGIKAVIAGSLATLLTASIAGLFFGLI